MNRAAKSERDVDAGFSLLELLVSMALMLIICSGVIGGMNYFQKNYRSNEERKSLQSKLRATVEQMSQEIGQAGLLPSGFSGNVVSSTPTFNQSQVTQPLATIGTNGVAAGATSLTVSSTSSMFPGEYLILDVPALNASSGAPEERVEISSVPSSTTLTLMSATPTANSHAAGASVTAQGVYPSGVWPTPAGGITNGTAQTLTIFGDINADGSMVIVKYACPGTTATTVGPFQRYQYNVAGSGVTMNTGCGDTGSNIAVPNMTTTLIDNVSFCQFTYTPVTTSSGNTYVLSVGVSLTVQSQNIDPQTRTPITVTKNIMNIQPRNIVNAYNLDTATAVSGSEDSYAHQLQQLPNTLPGGGIFSQSCIP